MTVLIKYYTKLRKNLCNKGQLLFICEYLVWKWSKIIFIYVCIDFFKDNTDRKKIVHLWNKTVLYPHVEQTTHNLFLSLSWMHNKFYKINFKILNLQFIYF